MLDRDAALFVARAEAERLVTTGISIGTRIDLYCSATGRVLLSGWDDERLAAYLDRIKIEARTKHALVKKAALRDAVRDAKAQGYAFTDQELEIGLRSIAIPVVDSARRDRGGDERQRLLGARLHPADDQKLRAGAEGECRWPGTRSLSFVAGASEFVD